MAFKSVCFLLLVVLLLLHSGQEAEGNNNFNIDKASESLSEKGYHTMSMIFNAFFKTESVAEWLTGKNSTLLTVFCPPDHAFVSSSKYPQPPLTLLQYHVVPQKLGRKEFGKVGHGSKVNTLLLGHPLVFTALPEDPSLNGVKVTEWNVYSDGGLVVHGVESFFDPAFQTILYPWFDFKNDQTHARNTVTQNGLILILSPVIALSVLVLSLSLRRCLHHSNRDLNIKAYYSNRWRFKSSKLN